MNDFDRGYPNLATFHSSSEEFAIYRRFGYLSSRLLLDRQDHLRNLEEKLDKYDESHRLISATRVLPESVIGPRNSLLGEIEEAFKAYGDV